MRWSDNVESREESADKGSVIVEVLNLKENRRKNDVTELEIMRENTTSICERDVRDRSMGCLFVDKNS